MIGSDRLLSILSRLEKSIKADGVSICAHAKARRVFRFASDAIHQDIAQESIAVTVKVINDKRIGIASTDTADAESLKRCRKAALTLAKLSPQRKDIAPLPSKHRVRERTHASAATAGYSPKASVESLKNLMRICQGAGASLAGASMTGEDEFAVVNSSGVSCYSASTVSGVKLVTLYRELSGYASAVHHDVTELNPEEVLKRSLMQSLRPEAPLTLPIGSYDVILEPEAVSYLIIWLGYTAFGAKSFEERSSFLAGHMGERLMDPHITLYDDGTDPEVLGIPFDFEGTPKKKVLLIDRGKAIGIVYDTTYGARFGQASTGHALSPDDTEGPMPLHLCMSPGTQSTEELIRSCERGLLIPRFHYVNGLLNPREALMTGLTREGAWLIENGRPTRPLRTLRFTQSIVDALNHVAGISKERRLIADPSQEIGCTLMPALYLKQFHFTGQSQSA